MLKLQIVKTHVPGASPWGGEPNLGEQKPRATAKRLICFFFF